MSDWKQRVMSLNKMSDNDLVALINQYRSDPAGKGVMDDFEKVAITQEVESMRIVSSIIHRSVDPRDVHGLMLQARAMKREADIAANAIRRFIASAENFDEQLRQNGTDAILPPMSSDNEHDALVES